MNKIGIRAHDFGRQSIIDLAESISAMGFDGVQLVFKKAFVEEVNPSRFLEIEQSFSGLSIMMIGAYFNPVHPDEKEVHQGIRYFQEMLSYAKRLGAYSVGSETGSLMGSPWNYVPENHGEEALNRVTDVFKGLVREAEALGKTVAVEGAYAHVAYSPKRIRTLLDRIQSPSLKVIVDLYNFLHLGNHHTHLDILDECIRLFKNDIIIFHLKDYVIHDGMLKQVGLGQGLMQYPAIIERIVDHCPNAHLIFEGVTGHDIRTSLDFIKNLLERKCHHET